MNQSVVRNFALGKKVLHLPSHFRLSIVPLVYPFEFFQSVVIDHPKGVNCMVVDLPSDIKELSNHCSSPG